MLLAVLEEFGLPLHDIHGDLEQSFVTDFEAPLRKKDNSEVECLISSTIFQDEQAQTVGYQGNIRDISSLKSMERDLKAYNEQLEQEVIVIPTAANSYRLTTGSTTALSVYPRRD